MFGNVFINEKICSPEVDFWFTCEMFTLDNTLKFYDMGKNLIADRYRY